MRTRGGTAGDSRSRSESGGPSRLAPATVVLNVNHRPVAEVEHLVKLLPSRGKAHGNKDLVGSARLDVHLDRCRIDPRLAELGDLPFEDRPGLVRSVSKRRRPVPRASTRDTSPVNLAVEHRYELS